VNNAFLNGYLEEIYMTQPPGFADSDKKYGLQTQESYLWVKTGT